MNHLHMYWEVFLKEEYFAFRIFILWTTLSNAKNTCISKWLVWTLLLYFYTTSYFNFEVFHKLQIASASRNYWFQLFVILNVFLCCLQFEFWSLKMSFKLQYQYHAPATLFWSFLFVSHVMKHFHMYLMYFWVV